jgi:hypothetical protein
VVLNFVFFVLVTGLLNYIQALIFFSNWLVMNKHIVCRSYLPVYRREFMDVFATRQTHVLRNANIRRGSGLDSLDAGG